MESNSQIEYEADPESFSETGQRLNHILDQIGFKERRGRVSYFQKYLSEHKPETFSDLNYSTVRSWFKDSSPSMLKIDVIISALQESYSFNHNIPQIKTWWKVGGYYPFIDAAGDVSPTILDLQKTIKENKEKKQFIVMSLVTEITGDAFNSLTSEDLVQIKDSAIKMIDDYADPFKIDCPSEYIKIAIQNEFESILNKNK